MKRIVILFLAALFAASGASAQKFHNAYYDTRRAAHDEEGLQQGAIVFLGNSITEQGWWSLLLNAATSRTAASAATTLSA